MCLNETEKQLLSSYQLNLGGPGNWKEHRTLISDCAIGPFDTHIVDSYETLDPCKRKAILSGLTLAMAGLAKLRDQIIEAQYPYDYMLEIQIEDSWLLDADTPPEIHFVASSNEECVRSFLDANFSVAVEINPGELLLPHSLVNAMHPCRWFVTPPHGIDYRYFINVIYVNPTVERYLQANKYPMDESYSQVLKRIIRFLVEKDCKRPANGMSQN